MDSNVIKILDDHEGRIRRLEEQSTATMIRLANIEKGQAELKNTIYETAKDNQELMKQMMGQMSAVTERLLQAQEKNSKNVWDLLFKIWAVIGPALGAGLGYLFKK
ncbi:hypothetical protein KVG29_08895 [Caldicoprobacter algeriensis]|uniref:hypothetical protein n=1 Tax=Caldicoprobacter algeriensis TaxID=699281 RepID=UPI0020794A13|nr:hypothetical protein [Caldicoprobacter algeriensis]MCM8901336.1 hypothetical protein [Caldicoprobacter algeriensis]